jgi:hypothetical protein
VLRVIDIAIVVIIAGLFVFHGALMLVSPKAWLALPYWIRGNGREEEYGSGWGAVQVRIIGALFLGGIGWVLYDFFFAH